MKNLISGKFITLLTIMVLLFSGCKKDFIEKNKDGTTKATQKTASKTSNIEDVIGKMNAWLDMKSIESKKKEEVINNLRNNINFESLTIHAINDSIDLVVVPIAAEFQTSNYKNAQNNLVFIFDENSNVGYCNIIQFISEDQLQVETLTELWRGIPSQNGKYVFLNLADKLMSEKVFEDRVLKNHTYRRWDVKEGTLKNNTYSRWNNEEDNNNCTTIWLVHTDVYTDHIEQTIDVIGTFCNNSDEYDNGGTGSNGDNVNNDEHSKGVDFEVARRANCWYVQSYEKLFAKEVRLEPGGGHFIKGDHITSTVFNYKINPFSLPNNPEPFSTYQELSNDIQPKAEWAFVTTKGKVTEFDLTDYAVSKTKVYGVWEIIQ